MIGIINYGMGNLHSVSKAVQKAGFETLVSSDIKELETCDKLILPGVGAFGDMMKALDENHLTDWIKTQVLEKKVPLLGICLGMQALFETSEEFGNWQGLGFLKGHVKAMHPYDVAIPAIGWNELHIRRDHPLKAKLSKNPFVYYDHSYAAFDMDLDDLAAYSDYGPYMIPGLVQKNHIAGCQFHPEKSSADGLAILKWFGNEVEYDPSAGN
jgi:glutamine amidotransferase